MHPEMEPILTRNTPNSETPALLDQRVYYFVRIFWNHFFFSILLITRTEETSLSVEVNMSTFHTWDERPLWIIVPTARTVSPSWADDIWLPLTCMPTTISSGFARIMEPSPATGLCQSQCSASVQDTERLAGPFVYRHGRFHTILRRIGILNA